MVPQTLQSLQKNMSHGGKHVAFCNIQEENGVHYTMTCIMCNEAVWHGNVVATPNRLRRAESGVTAMIHYAVLVYISLLISVTILIRVLGRMPSYVIKH